jgi:sugar O-acyltransferase (sialic acid O-acetyltransferase NeuD family)
MDLIIYGFGGHGKVVLDLARSLGYQEVGVFDERYEGHPPSSGITFLGAYDERLYPDVQLVFAMGDNAVRMRLSEHVKHGFATIVHPSASVSPSASVGHGTVVLQNAVIQAYASVGRHCIINVGAIVDHDSYVSDFCHLRPHCYIAGASRLSELTTIGPTITVPRNSTI